MRRRTDPSFVVDGGFVRSDAGRHDTSLAFSQMLHDHGLVGGIGRVGTAYDDALMERTIGLFTTELIHARAMGRQARQEVETAAACRVARFNRVGLHGELRHGTPVEIERAYLHQMSLPRQAA